MMQGLARAVYGAAKVIKDAFPRSTVAGKLWRGVKNWYEAGWPMLDGSRAYIPSLIQDARWDQNYITRREMMRRMRYWSQNSPLLESILSVGERYTVGPAGLHVSFYPIDDLPDSVDPTDSNDDPWYEAAELVTKEWFQSCGWNGESMAQLLKTSYRCQRVDGDVFILKTSKRGPLEVNGHAVTLSKPALLLIEAHRVETPFDRYQEEGHSLIDGVEYREVTRDGQTLMDTVGYQVRVGFGAFESQSRWVFVPKEAIFHIFNTHRANQCRGISDFYTVENALGKLEELVKLEMRAQDTQSDWAVLVKNAAGQFNPIDPKLQAIAQARAQSQPTSQTDPEKLTNIVEMYRKVYGGNTRAFKLNEDAQMMAPNRPAEATLQLWEFLINCVCAGGHAPRCLVFGKISAASAKSQGTEVRGELDSADAFYKGDHQKWKQVVKDAAIYHMEWAIRNDPRVADPPANWKSSIHVQQPEACNVDVGHTTQADLMMLAAGASDYDMILGPLGISFQSVARKLSRQQKTLKKLGVEVTLPALLPGQIPLDGNKSKEKEEPANA